MPLIDDVQRYQRARRAKSIAVVATLLYVVTYSWPQGIPSSQTPEAAPSWRYLPATTAFKDDRTPDEIRAEDEYFDKTAGSSDPLDEPQTVGIGRSGHGESNEDFPSGFSDEVVIGHFTTWTSRLSESRRSIYTTVNLQVDRIVSGKSRGVVKDSHISLVIPGGTVVLPGTQKIMSYFIRRGDFPLEPDQKYLIFLNKQVKLSIYDYIKAWKVDKGTLEPVSKLDAYRVSRGLSTHGHGSVESAVSELTSH